MDNPPSAAQKALGIGEILYIILGFLPERSSVAGSHQSNARKILRCNYGSCMLVNHFWYSIAAEFAWKGCGFESPGCISPHFKRRPWLSDFAGLHKQSSPERVRFYAQHIESLVIDDMVDDLRLWNGKKSDLFTEARRNRALWHISLPRLRQLKIFAAQSNTQRLTTPRILSNSEAKLTHVEVRIPSISPQFLNALRVRLRSRCDASCSSFADLIFSGMVLSFESPRYHSHQISRLRPPKFGNKLHWLVGSFTQFRSIHATR